MTLLLPVSIMGRAAFFRFIWFGVFSVFFLGCRPANDPTSLTIGAYTTPREAFREINPLFQKYYQEQTNQEIQIKESYLGSGAQSRAVLDGFPADLVVLSLEPDVQRLVDAGLITHDWQQAPFHGILTHSLVGFAVRKGNPKNIHDWSDLLQPGVEILMPNPKTSGGAMWIVMAAYGAAKLGNVQGFEASSAGAERFLQALYSHVLAMDKAARESMLTFEKGLGDVALNYENEILEGMKHTMGYPYELVIPRSTILVENPVALVDKNISRHQNRGLVEDYFHFLFTEEAQNIFFQNGFRPVNPEVLQKVLPSLTQPKDLFTATELGGWEKIIPEIFGKEGVFTRIVEKEK